MNTAVFSWLIVLSLFITSAAQIFQPSPASTQKCQPITVAACQDVGYNFTMMPNLLNHQTQEDAMMAMAEFNPLTKVKCSQDIKIFLCTLHVPFCAHELNQIVQPCRHLCMSAKRGCEGLMQKFGFKWPEQMNCDRFPDKFCVGENKTENGGEGYDIAPGDCPSLMRVPTTANYALKFRSSTLEDCSLPCSDNPSPFFFDTQGRDALRIWTAAWAAASLISSVFTIFTFLIDLPRFNYPVRPILYMAMCYAGLSVTYLIGVSNENKYSCSMQGPNWVVTQRLSSVNCTLMALTFHFCITASATWWLVLCLSWFLAARLQWGNESIASWSTRFHLFGWGIPALLSLLLLITETIDGDVVTGICSVGNLDGWSLLIFVVLPQASAILIGLILLASGITSMVRIRSYYKLHPGMTDNGVSKLEKLMLRVSLFALLYALPTALSTAICAYQGLQVGEWMEEAYAARCHSPSRGFLGFTVSKAMCPSMKKDFDKPDLVLFAAKYVSQLLVGITCAVWVLSLKTIASYQKAYARIFGKAEPGSAIEQ